MAHVVMAPTRLREARAQALERDVAAAGADAERDQRGRARRRLEQAVDADLARVRTVLILDYIRHNYIGQD